MKNNKIISVNLVKEGLRQLRLIGIIVTVITVLISFFLVYGQNMSQKESYEYSKSYGYIGSVDKVEAISGVQSGVIIIAATVIFSIIAMLILFSFLNKRNASDFYHGIPFKRYTLCLSFCLAILIWSAAIMLAGIVVFAVSIGVMKYVVFEVGYVADVALYTLIALVVVFFIEAVLLLSMSLSGTMLTNAAVAAMILFLPKCIFFTMSEGVLSDIPIYPIYEFSNGILSGKYNLVTGWLNAMFGVSYYAYSDTDWYSYLLTSCAYTFVLGAVIFAAGCVAFVKRKSEAATMAAVSEKVQLIFRIIPAFVVTIVGCIYIYSTINSGELFGEHTIFILAVIYVTAIVVYYLYEIITTRKWRNIVKATPGLLVLVVLDVLYIGFMFAQRNIVLNDVPKNLQSVRIIGTSMWDVETDDYFTAQSAKVEITDEEVLKILTNALEKDIAKIKNNDSVYDLPMHVMVCFNDNGRQLYRMLYMSEYDYNLINKKINTTDYKSIIKNIVNENITSIWLSSASYYDVDFDEMNLKDLLDTYLEDVDGMSNEKVMSIALGNYTWTSKAVSLNLNVLQGKETYYISLPVFYGTKAEKLVYDKLNQMNKNVDAVKMIDMIMEDNNTQNRDFESNLSLSLINAVGAEDNTENTDIIKYTNVSQYDIYVENTSYETSYTEDVSYGSNFNEDALMQIRDFMENNSDDSYTASSARLILSYRKYPMDSASESYERIYNISKGDVAQLEELIDSLSN